MILIAWAGSARHLVGIFPRVNYRTLLVAAMTFAFTAVASADPPSSQMTLQDKPLFPQGTKAIIGWGSYTPPIGYSSDHVYDASVGVSYYVWNNHAFNLVADGYHVDQEDGHTAEGSSISIMGRYHFFNRDPFTVYFDGGCGLSWFNSPMPKGGTTYDFNPRLGLGVGYHLLDNLWLTAGARYFHFSNARQHGPDKNPGYEGIECYIGFLLTLD